MEKYIAKYRGEELIVTLNKVINNFYECITEEGYYIRVHHTKLRSA